MCRPSIPTFLRSDNYEKVFFFGMKYFFGIEQGNGEINSISTNAD